MKVKDFVVPRDNPSAVPVEVIEIKDMGHGAGFERVKVVLFGFLIRYYAQNELQLTAGAG